MNRTLFGALAALSLITPVFAQEEPQGAPSPGEIVAEAAARDWVPIPSENLLVMTLAPDADGAARQVVIQLMPPPFSQGWVENIRTFARAKWYDNISVNRVQDNYVTQWGDPNYDNPEVTGEVKPLPEGLKVMGEEEYQATLTYDRWIAAPETPSGWNRISRSENNRLTGFDFRERGYPDSYADHAQFHSGWPVAWEFAPMLADRPPVPRNTEAYVWPIHCYGIVGVGRNYSPDTGSGAELYTVIGHAPRHLDRNIALVGRVIEGMEHFSSLPRGKGELGFYAADEIDKRTPILSVRVATDLPAAQQPGFEYLSTESETFAKYADARANRRDPFFIVPAGGADICNIPVPVRRAAAD
ncbi:MAG: peptidylprolyl isomerase [Allopontixanthobacter sediminis]